MTCDNACYNCFAAGPYSCLTCSGARPKFYKSTCLPNCNNKYEGTDTNFNGDTIVACLDCHAW